MEKWKPIPRKPSYSVSDLGSIRSPSGRLLVATLSGIGYPALSLGRDVKEYVHRCVASAFLGEIPEGMEINHKNGIKTDNRLANLEIVTRSENRRHSWQALGNYRNRQRDTRGVGHPSAKLSEDDVRTIRSLSESGVATVEIAARFQIDRAHVRQIVRRRKWAHLD